MSVWSFCWAYSEGSEVWWPAIGRGLFKWSPWILPFKDTFEQLHCNKYSRENLYTYSMFTLLLFISFIPKPNSGTQLYLWFSKEMDWIQSLQRYVWQNTVYEPTGYRSSMGRPNSLVCFVHSSKTKAQVGGAKREVQDCTALNLLCTRTVYAYLVFCHILQVSLG